MADETMTKKVTDLTESTEPTDEDLFLAGSAGTASLRKIKWSNIWTKITSSILNKLVANNLITTAAGFLLDARQGKVLDDKLTELNTKMKVSDAIVTNKIDVLNAQWCYTNTGSFTIPLDSTGSHTTIFLVIGAYMYAIYVSSDRKTIEKSSDNITVTYADGKLTIDGSMKWYCFGFYIVSHT